LGVSREGTDWASLLQVSVVYRLVAPGSEWRLHRQWYDQSAMKDLLAGRLQWGGKDQLYQVLDKPLATGLTPRQVLEQFAQVQMLDVVFPTTDGRKLVMSRYTQPDQALKLLMARLGKEFGEQPPPQLVATQKGQVEVSDL